MMRKQLSKSKIKAINAKIHDRYGVENFFDKTDTVELVDKHFIVRSEYVNLFYHDSVLYPSLRTLLKQNFLPKITVDKGAVRFVAGGADVMRPGIVKIEESVKKDCAVVIIDETHAKPLAVGVALLDATEMSAAKTGKVVKTIHYIGDMIWNYPT